MPAQDCFLIGNTVTATTTGTAITYGFRAGTIDFRNDGSGTAFIDFTQGASVTASTTGGSLVLKSGELLTRNVNKPNSWFSGFSIIVASGTTQASVRWSANS